MKKLKKLFAVMLSLIMVLAMGITSFAADNVIGNSDDTAEIKVTGIDSATSVKAYAAYAAAVLPSTVINCFAIYILLFSIYFKYSYIISIILKYFL